MGLECFEARPWYRELAAHAHCPRWRGEAPRGRHLLMLCEAGHGDMIQFLPLPAPAPGPGRPSQAWSASQPWCACPAISPPGWTAFPPPCPYLQAGAPERQAWRRRLPAAGLRVGLAWRGNPRFENDAERSLPGLWTLAPLAAVPGIALISLQKGEAEEEALWPPAACTSPPWARS